MRRPVMVLILAATLGAAMPASAQPDVIATRMLRLDGTFKVGNATYVVEAIYRTRAIASVTNVFDPFGGLVAMNPHEEAVNVLVCKPGGCLTAASILCWDVAPGITTDLGARLAIASPKCGVTMDATVGGVVLPRPVGVLLFSATVPAQVGQGATVNGGTALTQAATLTRTFGIEPKIAQP